MNDNKIYEQVAAKPGIRASEIATNLDLTLATVSADLRALVDAGDLVKRTEFSELGRQCQVYELSDDFKTSKTGLAVLAAVAGVVDAAPKAEPAPLAAVVVVKPAPPAAAPIQVHGPSMTKVQLGMACIVKLGSATDDQMRDAMGLPPKTRVQAYMAAQMRNSTVVRDGDRWKLGAGKPEAKQPDSIEKVGNIIVATKDASPVPQAVVHAIAAAPAPAAQAAERKHTRCRTAVWSDGSVEIKVPGQASLELSRAEFDEIVGFVRLDRAA